MIKSHTYNPSGRTLMHSLLMVEYHGWFMLFYLWYIHIPDVKIMVRNWFRLVQYTSGCHWGPRNTKTKMEEIRKCTGKVTGPGSTNPNVHPVRRPVLTLHSHREYMFIITWIQFLRNRSKRETARQTDRQTDSHTEKVFNIGRGRHLW